VAEGAPLAFGVSVSDPDSSSIASLSADLSQLPAGNGATFVTTADHRNGTFQWIPGFSHAGTYAVRWLANNALSDTAVTVLRVTDVDRAPVVAAPATVAVSAGTLLSLDVAASDPDGDAIAAFIALLGALPAGNNATFTAAADNRSGVLRWTPAATDTGVYPVSFQAINTLSGSGTTQVTVRAPNLAPTAAVVVTPATGNAPLSVTANASGSSDPEGNILSYRFDFGDGTIVGPQAAATAAHTYGAGSWTLSVTVTDTYGALNTVTAKVTVAASGPGPNLCTNSSFETHTNGWNAYSGSSYTRVSGGFDGTSALQVTGPATLSSFGINDSPNWVASAAGTGARYRFAAWVRSATANGAAKLQVREYLAGVKIGGTTFSAPVTLSPDWQLVIVDHVTQSSGSTLDLQVYETPQVPGETFLVDNIGIWLVPAGEPPILLTGPTAPEADLEAAPVLEFGARMVPSVAHGDATLHFTTTRRGPVRVSLFDASGRLVRTMLDEPDVAPGLHDLNVNGRGDRGDRLGSGLYFYRVQAAERTASGRVVFVR